MDLSDYSDYKAVLNRAKYFNKKNKKKYDL